MVRTFVDLDPVDVLNEIDTGDLIDELEARGEGGYFPNAELARLYEVFRYEPEKFREAFAQIVYERLGRVL